MITPTGNTGKYNTGNYNSGYRNSGYRNSGYRNSGDRNSGYLNSGYRNSGDRNSGYRNSGYRNSGYLNSGYRNSGDRNSGYLNSTKPTVRIFNKDTGIERDNFDVSFPDFFSFDFIPTERVSENDMTQEEKIANPLFNIAGGYLKKNIERSMSRETATKQMHEAWRKSWDKATDEDRRKVYVLPNWDNEVFKEISGIDVDKELNTPKALDLTGEEVEVTIKGKTYKAIIQ